MNINVKNYTFGDWAKLIANMAAAAGAGFAQGGYMGAVVTAIVAFSALIQTPPAHDSFPATK